MIRAIHIPRSPRFGSVMLAQLFGVSQPTIDRVVKRETYRHLHPLLLPAWQLYGAGHEDLGESSAKFGQWARSKTEYKEARTWIRDAFATGGYVHDLNGEFMEPSVHGAYVYAARRVRRVIKPEVEQQRRAKLRFAGLKWRFGDAFDERIGLAAAGLAPRIPLEEWRARLGKTKPKQLTQAEIDLLKAKLRAKIGE